MDTLISNLKKRNYLVNTFKTKESALEYLIGQFTPGKSIAWGGSVTLDQIGIKDRIRNNGYNVLDRDLAKTAEDKRAIQIQSFDADYYLTSTNAISEDGLLVNIDGNGNRMAAFIFGPQKVFVIAGTNKICKNEQEAIKRVRNYAAPKNTLRLNRNTPCAKTGTCSNCLSEDCICSHIIVTRKSWIKGRIEIILINEELGF